MKSLTAASRPAGADTSIDGLHPGLSSLLERRQLRRVARGGIALGTTGAVRSLRVLSSGLDAELSRAVDAAACRQRPLVAVLPLPLPAAPVAMAAAATIAAIAAAGRVATRTAVVSPRLAGRQMYDELLVERERLSVLVPRTTAGQQSTGSSVVTAHDCAQLLALESLDALTGLVLDLSAVEPEDLGRVLRHAQHRSARRPLLLLAMASSPLDPAVAAIRQANGLVYAVDQRTLAEQAAATPKAGPGDGAPLVCGTTELTRAGTASLEVRDCGDAALDSAAAAMWAATAALGRASADGTRCAGNLRWAWAVTSSFSQLATSAARADYNAPRGPWGPPALLDASQRARDLAVSENESLWLRWAETVDAATAASGPERKAGVVAQIAADHASGRNQPLLVLTRNRASAAALTAALLEDRRAPARIQVASMRDFAASRLRVADDALVVITGPLPRQYAAWLCVPPADGLLLLTAGPWQTLRAAEQAINARAALLQARRGAGADGLVAGKPSPLGQAPVQPPPLASVITGGTRTSFEASPGLWDAQARSQLGSRRRQADNGEPLNSCTDDDGLWSPFQGNALAFLERSAGQGSGASDQMLERDVEGRSATAGGAAVMSSGAPIVVLPIGLQPLGGGGTRTLLHPPDETVTRRDGLQVKVVAARALQVNDLVALVDGQARQDLFGHMVDTLEESAEWGLQVALARLWQRCVQRIPGSGMSYAEIRQRSGISVQPKTIGTWARGQAECPLDPEDVRRLARVLKDEDVLSRADAVATALRALWRLHQKAGRWLSDRLAHASRVGLGDDALRGRTQDEVLDPSLGLRASDLLGSVHLYRVVAVGDACYAPSGAAGSPLPPGDVIELCSPITGVQPASAPRVRGRAAKDTSCARRAAPARVADGAIRGLAGAPLDTKEALARQRLPAPAARTPRAAPQLSRAGATVQSLTRR
jgi:hypothetical protein